MTITVGEKIKKYRIERGMTQEELGKVLGVGRAAVQKYETNQVQNLKSSHIKKLCFLFNRRPWEFIFDGESPKTVHLPTLEENIVFRKLLGDELMGILEPLAHLNNKGIERVQNYIYDISRVEEYRK